MNKTQITETIIGIIFIIACFAWLYWIGSIAVQMGPR